MNKAEKFTQDDAFDLMIGRLDSIISLLLITLSFELSEVQWQTLKHHGEDMVAAGEKILKEYMEYRAKVHQ